MTEEEQKNNEQFVLKVLDCKFHERKRQEREVIALQYVQYLPEYLTNNIIKLQNTYWNQEEKQILMVLPKAKTSFEIDIVKRNKFKESEKEYYTPKQLCYYLSCALLGLSALDTIGILHRDIKPGNMLIMEDGKLVLSDYGTSKKYEKQTENTVAGTYIYFTPELLQKFQKDKYEGEYENLPYEIMKDNDLYGIGLSFIKAACLRPLPGYISDQYIDDREKWYEEAYQIMQGKYSDKFILLLQKMVMKEPQYRWKLEDCLDLLEKLPDW